MLKTTLFVAVLVVAAACAGPRPIPTPTMACPAGLFSGTLTEQAGELIVIPADTGTAERVNWPDGYTVRNEGGTLVVVNEFGSAVAREGDTVQLGGGELTEPGTWDVCGLLEVIS